MPAAAVIPALIAYIKVVAVKKLVVGCWGLGRLLASCRTAGSTLFAWGPRFSSLGGGVLSGRLL